MLIIKLQMQNCLKIEKRRSDEGYYKKIHKGIVSVFLTGINIYNQCYASALIYAGRTDSGEISAGWAAICPILYDSEGNLIKTGEWWYSPSGRYGWGVRWTSILDEKVRGKGYRVIEEGLCGRTP